MTIAYEKRKKAIRKKKKMEEKVWKAKMLGKYSPREGESIKEAYERTYDKDGNFKMTGKTGL